MWDAIIAAASGLFGVLLGGFITAYGHRKQRSHDRAREQLAEFYAPLLGKRAMILAKSEVRVKVSGATGRAWQGLFSRHGSDAESAKRIDEERFPDFEKVLEYNDRQLVEEILPLYRQMVEVFSQNMGLAEPSTRAYFGELVEFVEVWDRWLSGSLPREAIPLIGHTEDKLRPFYEDLATQLDSLGRKLRQ